MTDNFGQMICVCHVGFQSKSQLELTRHHIHDKKDTHTHSSFCSYEAELHRSKQRPLSRD